MNTIQCCDYLELLEEIPDNSVDAVITDPIFGINYANNYTHHKHEVMIGDNAKFSYKRLAEESFRILKNNSACFIFTGWSEYPTHYKEMEDAGFSMKEPLIGQKRASGKSDLYGSFQSNSDWVMFGHKGRFIFKPTHLLKNKRAGTIPNIGRKAVPEWKTRFPSCWFGSLFPYSTVNSSFQKQVYHPTVKNIDFIKFIIQLTTNEGDIVVDPFVGSGTTALACKRLNRNFICGDISKEFCELSEGRLNAEDSEN